MATSMRLPAASPPTREVKSASSSATRRLVPWLLLASTVLNGYHIWWGLPLTRPIALEATHVAPVESARGKESRDQENVVAWGTDEVAPMGPLVYAKRTFTGGSWSQKYPAFHFMLLNAAYAPVLGYLFLSGQISLAHLSDSWPYGLKDPVSSLTLLVLIARAVSVAMGTAIVGLTYLITERLFGGIAGIFTALILALCPMFIYYSHTSNLDIPYLFWFVLGCVFYVRLFEGGQTRDYVLFGVCMALTVATKDQAYALLPLLPVSLILSRMRRRTDGVAPSGDGGSPPSIPWRKLGLSLVAFLATYAVAANIPNNWSGYLRHVQHITGPGSAQYQEFPGTLSGQVALLSRTIALLAKTMNVPLFAVSAVGIVWGLVRFRRASLALLAPAISYYGLFIAVILYVYPRFLLPLVLVFSVFGGKLLADFWTRSSRLRWVSGRASSSCSCTAWCMEGRSIGFCGRIPDMRRSDGWERTCLRLPWWKRTDPPSTCRASQTMCEDAR